MRLKVILAKWKIGAVFEGLRSIDAPGLLEDMNKTEINYKR